MLEIFDWMFPLGTKFSTGAEVPVWKKILGIVIIMRSILIGDLQPYQLVLDINSETQSTPW